MHKIMPIVPQKTEIPLKKGGNGGTGVPIVA